jgi:hypothetical protein
MTITLNDEQARLLSEVVSGMRKLALALALAHCLPAGVLRG